jgi:hypothetical protein
VVGETNFDVVVCGSLVRQGWIEGDLVVGLGVGEAFLQKGGHIVVGGESKTTALCGEHLESQVPRQSLLGLANSFEELHIVEGVKAGVGGA